MTYFANTDKMTEFNLSDKKAEDLTEGFFEEDVKEFIREIGILIKAKASNTYKYLRMKQLAGPKLK